MFAISPGDRLSPRVSRGNVVRPRVILKRGWGGALRPHKSIRYVQAFRERNERRHITRVRPYLFRMVSNRCIDVLRARSRQSGDPITDEQV